MKLFNTSSVQDIANAIRSRNGLSSTYKIAEMASAVSAIATDGTATADKILSGYTAYGLSGQKMVGTAQDSGGTAIVIIDEPDEHGGTIRHINGVSLDGDTVSAGTMFSGVTAHNNLGSSIVGTYVPPTIEAGYGYGQKLGTTIFPPYGVDAMSIFSVDKTQLGYVNIVPSEGSQVITPPSDTLVYEIVTSNIITTGGKYTKSFTFPTSYHKKYRLKGEVVRHEYEFPFVIDFTFWMPYYYDNGAWYDYNGEQVDSSSEVARAIQTNEGGGIEIILTLSSLTLDIGGNYNITVYPTGLYEPSDYDGYDYIDVEPISSTYVGSGVSRMSSSNLTFATGTGVFTAPSGYYSANATYTLTPKTSTNIAFNTGTGVFTVSSGYYSSSPTLTLSTKAGTTITPTESEQIAVSSYYYAKGSIKVAGISSDYVGTNVSRMSSSNLTFATGTGVFTAPKGYYSANATYTLTPKTSANITFNSGTGVFTVSSGYYSSNPTLTLSTRAGTTITPISTGSQIAVSSGYFATGSVYVGAIPNTYIQPTGTYNITSNGTYNISSYSSVSVSVAGGEYYSWYKALADRRTTIKLSSFSSDTFNAYSKINQYQFVFAQFIGGATFENVTSVGWYGFSRAWTGTQTGEFNSIGLPSCTSIGTGAFESGTIQSAYLPLITVIPSSAFNLCTALQSIVTGSITSIGDNAFSGCRNLSATPNISLCTSIGSNAFGYCSSITFLSIPELSIIPSYMCRGCISLSNIYAPKCEVISAYAFNGCTLLESLSLSL
jgi:hypothetical protein